MKPKDKDDWDALIRLTIDFLLGSRDLSDPETITLTLSRRQLDCLVSADNELRRLQDLKSSAEASKPDHWATVVTQSQRSIIASQKRRIEQLERTIVELAPSPPNETIAPRYKL